MRLTSLLIKGWGLGLAAGGQGDEWPGGLFALLGQERRARVPAQYCRVFCITQDTTAPSPAAAFQVHRQPRPT